MQYLLRVKAHSRYIRVYMRLEMFELEVQRVFVTCGEGRGSCCLDLSVRKVEEGVCESVEVKTAYVVKTTANKQKYQQRTQI